MHRLCSKVTRVFDRMMERSTSTFEATLIHDCSVLGLALRITGSEQAARSIYRETFLGLHGKISSISGSESSLCVLVYRLATNLCLDHLRRMPVARPSRPALQALSPHERMVLELKHYHGMKLRTVSEVLNTTEEIAKDILFRATHKMRCFEA